MYWLIRFGTTVLPTQKPVHFVGVGNADNVQFLPLPGGGVFRSLGSEQAAQQGTVAQFRGIISELKQSKAALETQERALRALFGKRDKLYRRWDDSLEYEWAWATLTHFKADRRIDNQVHLDLALEFMIQSPVWYGERHGDGWILDDGEYLNSGLMLDEATGDVFTLAAGSGNVNTLAVNNGGNATITNAVVTINCVGTNITAVLIQRKIGATVYEHLTYANTVTAGQSLEIDCGAATVKNNGVADYDNFALGASHITDNWLRLLPGDNDIKVTLTGGGATSTIEFAYCNGWQ